MLITNYLGTKPQAIVVWNQRFRHGGMQLQRNEITVRNCTSTTKPHKLYMCDRNKSQHQGWKTPIWSPTLLFHLTPSTSNRARSSRVLIKIAFFRCPIVYSSPRLDNFINQTSSVFQVVGHSSKRRHEIWKPFFVFLFLSGSSKNGSYYWNS